jgi:TetR/AcrR family transcriptional repressor of nem operon
MARTRELSPPEALDKAMRVFWEKSYFGTSIEDLVSATGVSRYGL